MYLKEIAIGNGDVAVMERIASQLIIAKQIEQVTGEVPGDFAFYKPFKNNSYELRYSYELILEDIAEAVHYLGLGECLYEDTPYGMYVIFSLLPILSDVDFSDLFDNDDFILSWEADEEECPRWENGLLVAEMTDFKALPYEITERLVKAYVRKMKEEE